MNEPSHDMTTTLSTPVVDSKNSVRRKPAEIVEDAYRTHYRELFRYLLLSGSDEADAREFLQEGFLRMVRHLKEGKTIDTPKHWLLRVLQNLRSSEYQRTSRYVAVDANDLEAILNRLAAEAPDPEAAMLNRERYERVRAAMAGLTDRQYQCVLLRANGLKLREIADLFGISVVTVAEACGRAVENLGRLKI
ncbi:MAG: sigma-70 family RNA polymerase sigma factor, partial [Ignavibacteriota bacterium]